ncbi:MAG TPA: hypothetical protein VJB12_00835, partial [Candidatus Nanoarchaeia archaeon]|nr:hypothetical protein [Candidatus Nanoarchaeia archaeon]
MRIAIRSIIVSIGIMVIILSILTSATPDGPNSIERGPSERKALSGGSSQQQATGGNTTPLNVNSDRITQRWQGYFGNVSGGILLSDASGNNLYQWGLVNPSGEIYASNGSSVTWIKIDCINFTSNPQVLKYNLSELNEFIGYTTDAQQASEDTFNVTFNQTFGNDGSTFTVGSRTFINADNCSMTTLNTDSGYQ